MNIAVTDANIFIDLIKLQLLEHLFSIDCHIHTTSEVLDELYEEQKLTTYPFLQTQQLTIYTFSIEEIIEINNASFPNTLSFQDKTVVYYAVKFNAIILSGDRKLKNYCLEQQLDVKGIIWLFDKFVERMLLSKQNAAEKMVELLAFNTRLPLEECNKRIKEWSS